MIGETDTKRSFNVVLESFLCCPSVKMAGRELTAYYDPGHQ